MPVAAYDRSSKWLIQHYGDAILRLAGVHDVIRWRALQAELVQPGQLPDGFIEAERAGMPEPTPFVVEIATYPERRLEEQLLRDTLLVLLDRRVVPSVVALILRPRGRLRVAPSVSLSSSDGITKVEVQWCIVELWSVPAEELLLAGDPGMMPWVPLMRFSGPPEPVFRRCREVIDGVPSQDERSNLLAVTQELAGLRYNDPQLLILLGGRAAMIESPVLQELEAEWTAKAKAEAKADGVLRVLRARFGAVPSSSEAEVRAIESEERLNALLESAARCPDLEAFRLQLRS